MQTVEAGCPSKAGLAPNVEAKACGPFSFKVWVVSIPHVLIHTQLVANLKDKDKGPPRTFFFTAESEEDRDKWVNAIIAELQVNVFCLIGGFPVAFLRREGGVAWRLGIVALLGRERERERWIDRYIERRWLNCRTGIIVL